jgi:hypothetical protein
MVMIEKVNIKQAPNKAIAFLETILTATEDQKEAELV